jgi:hypothetical protein
VTLVFSHVEHYQEHEPPNQPLQQTGPLDLLGTFVAHTGPAAELGRSAAESQGAGAGVRRLRLLHGYHDALVREVRYRDGEDVLLDVDLCGCCNPSPGTAVLALLGVRNFAAVRAALEAARAANAGRGRVDELVGVGRPAGRGYLLDLMAAGPLVVDARSLHEA